MQYLRSFEKVIAKGGGKEVKRKRKYNLRVAAEKKELVYEN